MLVTSLEAIERVCTQEKANAQSGKKTYNKGKKSNKQPGTESTARVPKKAHTEKHWNLCKKHGGRYTTHNTRDCCKYKKDRKEKPDVHAAKKGGKKPNPTRQNFARLSKKLDKLEKALKKQSFKSKKHHHKDRYSGSK